MFYFCSWHAWEYSTNARLRLFPSSTGSEFAFLEGYYFLQPLTIKCRRRKGKSNEINVTKGVEEMVEALCEEQRNKHETDGHRQPSSVISPTRKSKKAFTTRVRRRGTKDIAMHIKVNTHNSSPFST